MAAITPNQGIILSKIKAGKEITDAERLQLFSLKGQYSESDGTAAEHEGAEVSSGTPGKDGLGSTVAAATRDGVNAFGADIPGLNGATALAGGLIDGKNAAQVSKDTALGFTSDVLGEMGLPGEALGFVLNMALSDDPARTATTTTAALTGAVIGSTLSPLGAFIGSKAGSMLGSAAYGSFNDGLIGDALDSRTGEAARDRAEDMGYSYGDTASAAGVTDSRDSVSGSGYGGLSPGVGDSGYGLAPSLGDLDSASSYGNLKEAGENALGDPNSLGNQAAGEFGGTSEGGRGGAGSEGEGGRGNADGADSAGNAAGQGQGGSSGSFA